MRYNSEHKERTRRAILTEAAAAIRDRGPDRVGVAEIMGKLGLTHGGFYAHFESKDALVAEAITHMLDRGHARFLKLTEGRPPAEGLVHFIDSYLSVAHRDERGKGCALAALCCDLPRMGAIARKRFTEGALRLPASMARLLAQSGVADAESLSQSAVAEMAGALALSRAISDPQRSEHILENSRRMVKARLGLPQAPWPEGAVHV